MGGCQSLAGSSTAAQRPKPTVTLEASDNEAAYCYGVSQAGRAMAMLLRSDVDLSEITRHSGSVSLQKDWDDEPLDSLFVLELVAAGYQPSSSVLLPELVFREENAEPKQQWSKNYRRGAQAAISVLVADMGASQQGDLKAQSRISALSNLTSSLADATPNTSMPLDLNTVFSTMLMHQENLLSAGSGKGEAQDPSDAWYQEQALLLLASTCSMSLISGCSDHQPRGSMISISQKLSAGRESFRQAERRQSESKENKIRNTV